MQSQTGGDGDIWVYEMERGVPSQLTLSARLEWFPVWSADGRQIYYALASGVEEEAGLYRRNADGSGSAERLLAGEWLPTAAHPDGRRLAVQGSVPGLSGSMAIFDLESRGEPTPLADSAGWPAFSPDGKWLAYTSTEAGSPEVHVRSLEDEGRWQISDSGGAQPPFAPNGREIYYRADRQIMVVAIDPRGDALRPGRARKLLDIASASNIFGDNHAGVFLTDYDTRDGEQFVMISNSAAPSQDTEQRGTIVLNWFDELKRLVPTDP